MLQILRVHPYIPTSLPPLYRWQGRLWCLILITMAGCLGTSHTDTIADLPAPDLSTQQLADAVDRVLNDTLTQRRLNTETQAAWQILHGVLAYGQAFPVDHGEGTSNVVAYLQKGGSVRGFVLQAGRILDETNDRRGLIAVMQPGTKAGQGHADQWLAILAQADLTLSDTIQADGRTFTMSDFVEQVKWDVPRNLDQEYSWTLIGLTQYFPTSASWEAADGETWSIERLVELESDYALGDGPCGGTHRLIGLAMALEARRREGLPIKGVWAEAAARVQQGVLNARRYQNQDGSFSTHYVNRGGTSRDLAQNLGTTGHLVEFLAIALPDDEIQAPWVQAAVNNLCELFDKTQELDLECGALYHAAHGLVLYRNRLRPDSPYQAPVIKP
jgi:hypothetical protein